jgi:hypothetical protein
MEGALLIDVFEYKICPRIQTMKDLQSILHASPALYRRRQSILAAFWRRMNPPAGRFWLVHARDGILPGDLHCSVFYLNETIHHLHCNCDIDHYLGENLRFMLPTMKEPFFIEITNITADGTSLFYEEHKQYPFLRLGISLYGWNIITSIGPLKSDHADEEEYLKTKQLVESIQLNCRIEENEKFLHPYHLDYDD